MRPKDVVVFIVSKEGKILAEKRREDNPIDPGKISIPGGHVKEGESFKDACRRELKEELDLDSNEFEFVTKMVHTSAEYPMLIHYYKCKNWEGNLKSNEAEEVHWIGPEKLHLLDFEIDRQAAKQFFQSKNI